MENLKEVLLSNRFKSFYWRSGAMFAASFLSMMLENLTGLGLSGLGLVLTGLVLGEMTKALNNFANEKEA